MIQLYTYFDSPNGILAIICGVAFILGLLLRRRFPVIQRKVLPWVIALLIVIVLGGLGKWQLHEMWMKTEQLPLELKLADCTNNVVDIHLKIPTGHEYQLVLEGPGIQLLKGGEGRPSYSFSGHLRILSNGSFLADVGGGQYLRLSEMNLGGSGTNGLKWMALLSCNSLQHNNWANMQSLGVKPYNSNLHLLLGVDTTNFTSDTILWYWAKYMNYGTSTNAGNYAPMTIRTAWYQAAEQAYADEGKYMPSGTVIKFAVAGDTACANDSVTNSSAPGGVWFYDTPVTVFSK